MFNQLKLITGMIALTTLFSFNANAFDLNDRISRPEARRIVEKYYNAFLLRSSEAEGRRFWIRTLRREGYNFLPEMAYHFCNSEEFNDSTLKLYRPRRIVRNIQDTLGLIYGQNANQRFRQMMRRQKNNGGDSGARVCRRIGEDYLWSL